MTFKTELLDYQVEAVQKLSKLTIGALYMEMGTGKTRTALELVVNRIREEKVEYCIWLCPCSVKSEIRREIKKHLHQLDDIRIEGIQSLSSSIKLNSELLELAKNKKCYLVVDESNLVKNHKAIRSQNISRLAEHCKYKLILNGTPISKNETDLFWQWYILDWRVLGYRSYYSFAYNHIEFDQYGKLKRVLDAQYLVRKIAPYSYQVKKDDVLNLTKKTYSNVFFNMSEEQRRAYHLTADEYIEKIDEEDPTTIYRMFSALQHVLSGKYITSKYKERMQTRKMFSNIADNPRIKRLLDVIEKEKTIIFCKYTDEINDICEALGDDALAFHGGISIKKRDVVIEQFRNDKLYLVCSKNTAGYGLNLQFCSRIIYYNNDFDFATRMQSEDRVHRLGQLEDVQISNIIAPGTLDERIWKCLCSKESLSDYFKNQLVKLKDFNERRKWINGEDI